MKFLKKTCTHTDIHNKFGAGNMHLETNVDNDNTIQLDSNDDEFYDIFYTCEEQHNIVKDQR